MELLGLLPEACCSTESELGNPCAFGRMTRVDVLNSRQSPRLHLPMQISSHRSLFHLIVTLGPNACVMFLNHPCPGMVYQQHMSRFGSTQTGSEDSNKHNRMKQSARSSPGVPACGDICLT